MGSDTNIPFFASTKSQLAKKALTLFLLFINQFAEEANF